MGFSNGVEYQVVKSGKMFSYSVHGKYGSRRISFCSYCYQLWFQSEESATAHALKVIDSKITGKAVPIERLPVTLSGRNRVIIKSKP